MADINGGALSFVSIMDNDQLNAAIAETLRRVQGFSSAVVDSGDVVDKTTQSIVQSIHLQKQTIAELEQSYSELNSKINSAEPGTAQDELLAKANAVKQELDNERQGLEALSNELLNLSRANSGAAEAGEKMRMVLSLVGTGCEMNENALQSLETEYSRITTLMNGAYKAGNEAEYQSLKEKAEAIKGEIVVRRSVLKDLRAQSNAIEELATKIESERSVVEKAANEHVTLRTQIRNLKEEMASLVANGIDENSEAYKKLANELGRLQDIQGDIQSQGSVLANDEAQFAGMLSGLQGLVGGFTAAQGAVALFGDENEELQKIMLKVQSLMSITMGLQQVAQTLNKDSAFSLVTLSKAKEWWNNLLDIGRGKQIADTAALEQNTIAQGVNATSKTAGATAETAKATAQAAGTAATESNTIAQGLNTAATETQTVAATAGTVANIGLAGAFRMVGAALKSIPVFGWILAGISALIALVSHFVSKANEAKKAQEEWYKSVAENAYKPIGAIEELSAKWVQLGNDLKAKERFIRENKKAFDDLGVSVNSVTDAENLLIANKDRFIKAQIAKAKAAVYTAQALERVKELVEKEQEYKAMPDKVNQWVQTSSFGTGYYVEVKNGDKEKKKKEIEDLRLVITDGYKNVMIEEGNAAWQLRQANINSVNQIKSGTIEALEQAISEKQEKLKHLQINSSDFVKTQQEIKKLQSQLDKAQGRKDGDRKQSTDGKDPFLEKLEKYKSEYTRFMKWVNSGDAILTKAANQEFSGLLEQGATYVDYLKKQRDEILNIDAAKRTKEQNKQFRQLNDAIAEETKKTVLEAFNNELSEQLGNAKSTLEILNIIEQKRKQLSGDGTELDNSKKETLDNAEKDAKDKLEQELNDLLDEYATYAEKRLRIEERYNYDMELLRKKRDAAQSDSERLQLDLAIKNRTRKYKADTKGTGNSTYDAMIKDYGTFEQRKQAIIDEFSEKRRVAEEMGNKEMIESINKAQAQALSKFALDAMKMSPDWELMFGNLDEITTKKLEELIAKFENLDGAYLGVEFDPEALEALKKILENMKGEIQERNPFKALLTGIKDFTKAVDDESKKKALKRMFESASEAIDLIKGSLDAVVSGMDKMGIAMAENTQKIIEDIGGILDGAGQIAQGIATNNPLSIIQGSVNVLSSAFDLFNSRDRDAEKQIKKHQQAIQELGNAYRQLEWQIGKALGSEAYELQTQAIRNMKEQQKHLQQMIEAEDRKKKTDHDKIKEYKEQKEELDRQITDMIDGMRESLLGSDIKSIASQLGDALIEAFQQGKDAAKAWGDSVKNIIGNLVKDILIQKVIYEPIEQVTKKYTSKWVDENGNFKGYDKVLEDVDDLTEELTGMAPSLEQALSTLKDKLPFTGTENNTSLSGAVKGVSEETASLVAGQMNAIRINQLESTAILRQQLLAMNTIAQNTAYNRYLTKIDRIVSILESSKDSLRPWGLS